MCRELLVLLYFLACQSVVVREIAAAVQHLTDSSDELGGVIALHDVAIGTIDSCKVI